MPRHWWVPGQGMLGECMRTDRGEFWTVDCAGMSHAAGRCLVVDTDVPARLPWSRTGQDFGEIADAARPMPGRGRVHCQCTALLRVRCADIQGEDRDWFADAKTYLLVGVGRALYKIVWQSIRSDAPRMNSRLRKRMTQVTLFWAACVRFAWQPLISCRRALRHHCSLNSSPRLDRSLPRNDATC